MQGVRSATRGGPFSIVAVVGIRRSIAAPLRRHPRLVDALAAVALGLLFVLAALGAAAGAHYRESFNFELTRADLVLTVVSTLALTQVRRRPTVALVATAAAASVAIAGGWQMNLAVLATGIAMFGYALPRSRKRGIWVAAVVSVVLGAEGVVVAGVSKGDTGWENVVLWVWLGTALANAVQSKRAAVVALEDRARRAEESRDEMARRQVAEERVRIARELHDVIAHHVAVMSVQSGVAEHLIERDPAAARAAMRHVRASAKSVLSELQTVLGVLRQEESNLPTAPAPGLLEVGALVESFRSLGSSVELEAPDELPTLSPAAGLAAFRLVQEALTNVQKHATGAPATVAIRIAGDMAEVEVVNGPSPAASSSDRRATPREALVGSGLGMVGMRERVAAAGGSLEAFRTDDGGFRVAARLPLTEEDS